MYTYRVYLYNSTGRINEIIQLDVQGNNYNYSIPYNVCPIFYLHPYNANETSPDFSAISISSEDVAIGHDSETISSTVTSTVSEISQTQVYINFPDTTLLNYPMSNTGGDVYELILEGAHRFVCLKSVFGYSHGISFHKNHAFEVENEYEILKFNKPVFKNQ